MIKTQDKELLYDISANFKELIEYIDNGKFQVFKFGFLKLS